MRNHQKRLGQVTLWLLALVLFSGAMARSTWQPTWAEDYSFADMPLGPSGLQMGPKRVPGSNEDEKPLSYEEVLKVFSRRLPVEHKFRAAGLSATLLSLCKQMDLSPRLVLAVIATESSFNPSAVSSVGAIGLMQVVPWTAKPLSKELGLKVEGRTELFDPILNLVLGIHYLKRLLRRFDNDLRSSLIAYNLGPTRMVRLQSKGKRVPLRYYKKVLSKMRWVEAHWDPKNRSSSFM
jgi:hypothetical protein